LIEQLLLGQVPHLVDQMLDFLSKIPAPSVLGKRRRCRIGDGFDSDNVEVPLARRDLAGTAIAEQRLGTHGEDLIDLITSNNWSFVA
jgi:hypothetical protein